MIVKKKLENKEKDNSQIKKINEFINRGENFSSKEESINEIRFTLRLPKQLIQIIDRIRKSRLGKVSRNQIIIEILSDFSKCK